MDRGRRSSARSTSAMIDGECQRLLTTQDFKHVQGVLPPLEAHIKAQEHPPVAAAPDADGSPGPAVGPPLPLSPAASGAQRVDFKAAVRQALAVRDLRAASWAQVQPTAEPGRPRVRVHLTLRDSSVRDAGTGHQQSGSPWWRCCPVQVVPCAREGHAAASWGNDSMILFGGWGSGIRCAGERGGGACTRELGEARTQVLWSAAVVDACTGTTCTSWTAR